EGNLAETARAHKLDSAGKVRPAAALRSHLHDAIVPARSLDHAAAFDDVVRDRLFHVDMFAGLARPYRRQGMPVVRSRNDQSCEIAILQHPPHVRFDTHLAVLTV